MCTIKIYWKLTMKKIIFILSLLTSIHAVAQKTDYTGRWLIDKQKTDFEGARAVEWVVPRIISIDQHTDKLILTRTLTDSLLTDKRPIEEVLSFDGTPFKRIVPPGPQVVTSLHWLNDQSFKIGRKGTQTVTETWTLEDSGKTLIIVRAVETPE